jgi:predicted transcriptional regulator
VTTLVEIKEAISQLPARERAILSAELFAGEEPTSASLEAALESGLRDVSEGRVRPLQELQGSVASWNTRS